MRCGAGSILASVQSSDSVWHRSQPRTPEQFGYLPIYKINSGNINKFHSLHRGILLSILLPILLSFLLPSSGAV